MRRIEMVDLRSQYEKIKGEIDRGINEVMESCAFVKGSKVGEFEKHLAEYLGVRHVIAVGNGSDALTIALMALGLQKGDEVITSAFSFVSVVEAISLLGLKPVLADVERDTMNISVDAVRRAVTERTRAIVPVHLFGQNADMEPLLQLAKERGLYVIEDACQSIGAVYQFRDGRKGMSGCMGDMGCTSFFPSKNLGCYGDGGALFTNDDAFAAKARSIANHGMETRYHYDTVGINSRLDSIQAAVLDAKLTHLDEYTAARRAAAAAYDSALRGAEGLVLPAKAPYTTHVYHQYTVRIEGKDRDEVRKRLADRGVPSMIYYPIPLHLQRAYRTLGYKEGDFPVSERLASTVLSLPMHTELDGEQLRYIADSLTAALRI